MSTFSTMAKTRSRGPISPKTPLSDKLRKIKRKSVEEESPSVRKIKKVKPAKSEKSLKEISKADENTFVADKVAAGAVKALRKYVDSNEKPETAELFDDEDDKSVYLQITTKKFCSDKPNFKPKVIKITNPVYSHDDDANEFKICVFLRDQLVTSEDQLKQIESQNIRGLAKIITLKDLKTEYKPFEKRRQLRDEYTLFLVDDALLNSMPSALGKAFYSMGNNKIPVPIRVTTSSNTKQLSLVTLKNQVEKITTSAFFLPPMGVNITVRFGIINKFTNDQLVQNLQDVLQFFDKDALRSVMLKTQTSPALPIFYSEKLYSESDVAENVSVSKKQPQAELTAFERGLLELGAAEDVQKVVGKKLARKLEKQAAT